MSVVFDTSELQKLAADLNAGSGRLGAKTAAVFRKGAKAMEATMSKLAPVDTGELQGSVEISSSTVGDGRSGTMAVEIGATADHARYIEHGTSVMEPQPFVGPAFDQHVGALTAELAALGGELLR